MTLQCKIIDLNNFKTDILSDAIEESQRKQVYRVELKKIFYNNKSTFIFEKYVTKLKVIFNVLERYGVPLYEEQIVEHLLD